MQSPNSLPTLVGLTGKAGVGKDTLADYLVARHGFAKLSLAAPLKEAINGLFGFTPEQWDDREWKERVIDWIGKSPRQLAQTIGTEWGRECIAEDIWLRIAQRRIEQLLAEGYKGVVISDVRFDNEASFVRRLGGLVCAIVRDAVDDVSPHASERGVHIALIHHWIVNTGSREGLFASGDAVLSTFANRSTTANIDPHFA